MRNQTRNPKKASSHLPHKVATFRPTLAFRWWRLDGVSLLTICALVLVVPYMVPLVSVNAAQLSGTLSLFDVGESLEGAKFNGIANGDQSGISVSSAGDINGDGLDDLLIGAYRADADGTNRGESYLVYGQSTDSLLTGSLNLSDLGGAVAGAKFNGIANHDQSGVSVSGAGDVNGDGLDDLLVGAYSANPGGFDIGQSYLVYGQPTDSALTGSLNLSDVGDAVAGATFDGIADGDRSGISVSSAGDVNGDGLDDLLIGAYLANVGGTDRGESYLIYGQNAGSALTGSLRLTNVGGSLAGAKFYGVADGDRTGFSVSSAGDVNGDDLDDLLIGAYYANADGTDRGQSYLVYGQPADSPLTGNLNLSDVGGAVAGAVFSGLADNDRSGRSVSSAGDVNGDGLDDLLIGARYADADGDDRGESYLVYGQPAENPLTGSLNLSDVGGAVAGAIFDGIADDDHSGRSVSNAGDVNGDGLDDLLIGASGVDVTGSDRGESYLIYGQSTGTALTGSLNLSDVGGSIAGAKFNGIADSDGSGISVSSAGDVNGDGLDDLLIGASLANSDGDARGESYLVYGQPYASTWINPVSGIWDDKLNWLLHAIPDSTDDVFIQPSIGLTVQGPTTATTVKSLTIGAETTGTATLDLNSGTLDVTGQTTIEQRGTLTGTGIINLLGEVSNAGEIDLGGGGLQIAGGILTNSGMVRGSGKIDNALVNSADGEVRVWPGQHLHFTGQSAQTNAGDIDVVGNATQAARIEFDGALTNSAATGNISARNATMRFNDGLTNHGTIGISFGTSDVYGDIDNQSGGSITIQGNSNVTFWDDVTNNGTVNVSDGSTVVYFGTVTGVASFTGGGMTVMEGNLSPGNSPGTMTFGGDLVLGSEATTLMELAGTNPGEYDQLSAGTIKLSGNLNLLPIDGYVGPVVRGQSDDFVLVQADSRVNHFTTVTYDGAPLSPDFGPTENGSFRDHVGEGRFRNLTYAASELRFDNLFALQGDADGDQDVDITDFNALASHFDPDGATASHSWTEGNFNGDNTIDITDFNFLASNFASDGYGISVIPEPTSFLSALLGLILLAGSRVQ